MNRLRSILGTRNFLHSGGQKSISSRVFKIISSSPRWLVLLILISVIFSLSCSLSQLIPGQGGSGMITLGLIINQNYQPVAHAWVGENQLLTDQNGVVTGDLKPNQAGLIPVRAAGYVPGYGTGTVLSDGYQVMIVQLTAVETMVPVLSGQESQLTVGDTETPRLQVRAPVINTSEDQAYLQLAEINPLSMPQAWLENNSSDLNLQYSLSISAVNAWGDSIPVEESSEIMIANQGGDPTQMVLAYFDPQEGAWTEIPGGCLRADEGYLNCTIPHFSLFGIFGPGSGGGFLAPSGSDPVGSGSAMDAWADYYKALAKLDELYKGADQSGQMPDETILQKAIEDLKNAAERLANECSPEIGKTVLGQAAAHAQSAGQGAAAEALLNAARNLIKKMADDLLKDDSCKKIDELANVASQAMSVGGMPDTVKQLQDKLKDSKKECNTWIGTIHYSFFLDSSWPNNPQWDYYSGGQSWMEVHQVTITIDPETGAVEGDSVVTLSMPGAEYRLTKQSVCGPVHNHQHIDTGGGSGSANLSFEGSYHDGIWTIGPMEVESSSPVNLQNHAYYALTYAPVPPPQCIPIEKEISRTQVAEYTSQLIHGFFGSPEPPSLETMLNTGTRSQVMDTEVIRGTQDLSYSIGANLSPLIPVKSGTVTWNFIRVNKAGK